MALLYSDLIEITKRELSRSEHANARSALVGARGYLTWLGLSEDAPLAGELTDEPAINRWLTSLDPTAEPGARQSSTVRAYQARVLAWRDRAARLHRNTDLPSDPHERLKAVIQRVLADRGWSQNRLATELDVAPATVSVWVSGGGLLTRASAEKLEVVLELPLGTLDPCVTVIRRRPVAPNLIPADFRPDSFLRQRLLKTLPNDFNSLTTAEQQQIVTRNAHDIRNNPVRQKIAFQQRHPYGLPLETLPDCARREITDFLSYKTTPVLPRGVKRHAKGRVHRDASIDTWRNLFSTYYGWCVLPTREQAQARGDAPNPALEGAGLHIDELTIGLFAVPELVNAFFAWRYSPARQSEPNRAMLVHIGLVASLVHPETGYLTQHPELVHRIPKRYRDSNRAEYMKYLESLLRQNQDLLDAFKAFQTMGDAAA